MNHAVLPQGFLMIGKVDRGNLPPDVTPFLRAFGPALISGSRSPRVRPTSDVERGNPAVRLHAHVTNSKAEGHSVIARSLVVEPRALIPGFGDYCVAQGDPVFHQLFGAGFFNLLPQAVDLFEAA